MKRFLLILSISFLLGAFQTAASQEKSAVQKTKKPKIVSCDGCGQRPVYLAKPVYPKAARFRPSGTVKVEILIDEKGKVASAKVISGHPFFRGEAIRAALKSKFEPLIISGKAVKTRGVIVYNFIP
jgi:TonB family protein